MFEEILVPTDGSEVAENAAESAIELARRFDATVHALCVIERGELPGEFGYEDAFAAVAQTAVEDVAELAAAEGVAVETKVVESTEPAHRAIVEYAGKAGADLIVMGTHGRTGLDRYVLGSVAARTLRRARIPVLTVREGASLPAEAAIEDVLVPTDGSEVAQRALDRALDLAEATGAGLHLLSVVDTSVAMDDSGTAAVVEALEEAGERALDDAAERAAAADVPVVEREVAHGPPAAVIADYADDEAVDLIVMGTHGRTGLGRILLGSVTERVVRRAHGPVLTVPAPIAPE
ncbi:MAG: universal stress protein [Haloarculaceae archaeon]